MTLRQKFGIVSPSLAYMKDLQMKLTLKDITPLTNTKLWSGSILMLELNFVGYLSLASVQAELKAKRLSCTDKETTKHELEYLSALEKVINNLTTE